jgi:hypothetical protein
MAADHQKTTLRTISKLYGANNASPNTGKHIAEGWYANDMQNHYFIEGLIPDPYSDVQNKCP